MASTNSNLKMAAYGLLRLGHSVLKSHQPAHFLRLSNTYRALHATPIRLLSSDNTLWLAEKAEDPEVVTLDSGLMYKVLAQGLEGAPSPGLHSPCVCHYEGCLVDGTIFDSSRARGSPATFAPSQVIPGWTEALQLMKEGDHVELYIPSELAYGSAGAGGVIPPNAALMFSLELLQVKG